MPYAVAPLAYSNLSFVFGRLEGWNNGKMGKKKTTRKKG